MSAAEYFMLQQPGIGYALTICAAFGLAAYAVGCLVSRRNDLIAFALGILLTGTGFFAYLSFFPLYASGRELKIFTGLLLSAAAAGGYFFVRKFLKNKLLFAACTLLFAVLAGSALLPPYSWDEQVYQIELLSRYLQNNSIAILPDNPYSAWPGFLQTFLLPGFLTGGINFPRLFNTLLTVTLAGSLFSALRIYGRYTAAAVTAAVCISPLTLILTRSLYAENTTALFVLAGFVSLIRLRKKPAAACLLAGLFSGAALAVKLTSGGAALALFFFCAFEKRSRRYLALFICAAAVIFLPYLLRVWICTGNPFYPFAAGIFGSSQAVEHYHYLLGANRYGMGVVYGTVFGWISTAFAGKLYDGAVTGFQQLSMLAAVFWALRFSKSTRHENKIKCMFAAVCVMYLFWGVTSQQTRFLYPAFLLLAFPAAAALNAMQNRTRRIFLLLTAAGAIFSPALYPQAKHFFVSWRLVEPARKEPLRFLAFSQRDPDFIQILDAVGKTPRNSRILMLFERRGLYVPRRHEIADPGFQEKYFQQLPGNVDALMDELKACDYLLVGSNERNVDLQEKDIENQKYLMGLISRAVAENKLKIIAAGKGNSYYLLKK